MPSPIRGFVYSLPLALFAWAILILGAVLCA